MGTVPGILTVAGLTNREKQTTSKRRAESLFLCPRSALMGGRVASRWKTGSMFVELKQLVVHLRTLFQNIPSLPSMWAFGEKKS